MAKLINIDGNNMTVIQSITLAINLFHKDKHNQANIIYDNIQRIISEPNEKILFSQLCLLLGHFKTATKHLKTLVKVKPRDLTVNSCLAAALHHSGRHKQAARHYSICLDIAPNDAETWNNLGIVYLSLNEYGKAKFAFNKAHLLKPKNPIYLSALADVFIKSKQLKEAKEFLSNAILIDFKNPVVLNCLKKFSEEQAEGADSEYNYYQFLLELLPNKPEPYVGLWTYYENRNKLAEAKAIALEGLKVAPNDDTLILSLARSFVRLKQYDEAFTQLKLIKVDSLEKESKRNYYFEYAKLYNLTKNEDKALEYFERANCLAKELWLDDKDKRRYNFESCKPQLEAYQEDWISQWQRDNDWNESFQPIFFIGFPRSGTTLIERILDGHSRIETVSEKEMLTKTINMLEVERGNYPVALRKIDKDFACKLKKEYMTSLSSYADTSSGKLIIDKMPLHTAHVGLIKQLFPNAKFIFAIRHPYDSCLSCYMQNFRLNASMARFLSLESTGEYYSEVMELWHQYNDILELDVHQIKYEDIVTDLKGEVTKLLEFLGLEWESDLDKFYENKQNVRINTPSYHQVSQPLYKEVEHRWKRYPKAIKILSPLVDKYVEKFGYSK